MFSLNDFAQGKVEKYCENLKSFGLKWKFAQSDDYRFAGNPGNPSRANVPLMLALELTWDEGQQTIWPYSRYYAKVNYWIDMSKEFKVFAAGYSNDKSEYSIAEIYPGQSSDAYFYQPLAFIRCIAKISE